MASEVPALAAKAVLVPSGELPVEKVRVQGYDFNKGVDYHELLSTFKTSGFQATNFGLAVDEINRMVRIWNRTVYFISNYLNIVKNCRQDPYNYYMNVHQYYLF